jgi:hypothetical protein
MKENDKTKELILEQLRRTPIIEITCQKIGISRMTLLRWKKDSKKFSSQVEDALIEGRLNMNDIAENQILALISQGKFEPSKFWLTHNDPRYANKLNITGTLKHKDTPLSVEQKAVIKQALKLTSKSYEKKKK